MNSTTLSRHQTPFKLWWTLNLGMLLAEFLPLNLSSSDLMQTFVLGRCYWWAAVDIQTNGLFQEEEWSLKRSRVGPPSERCMKRWTHGTHLKRVKIVGLLHDNADVRMISVGVFSRSWERPTCELWESADQPCYFHKLRSLKMKVGDKQ